MAVELKEPFAEVEDLRAWWPDMPPGSDDHAKKLLLGASQFIVNANDGQVPEVADITLEQVTANIVRRAMSVPDEVAGYSQMQLGAGPYQRSGTVQNPNGDFYLTKQEKQQLGVGSQKAYEVDLLAGSRRAYEKARRAQG